MNQAEAIRMPQAPGQAKQTPTGMKVTAAGEMPSATSGRPGARLPNARRRAARQTMRRSARICRAGGNVLVKA
jgi:hypothetical protein